MADPRYQIRLISLIYKLLLKKLQEVYALCLIFLIRLGKKREAASAIVAFAASFALSGGSLLRTALS